jgi:hypothetical protein
MRYDVNTIALSEDDPRDLVIEALQPDNKYPRSIDLRNEMPPVWDQGVDGPCSAYAAAAIKMWQERKDYGLTDQLSTHFVYNLRPNRPQKGMQPRHTMHILKQYGIPTAKSYHRRKMKELQNIPAWVLNEAANHKIIGYARIQTIEGLKKSIYKNGPAYIAMPVYNDGPQFWKPSFGDQRLGGHALVIVGYNSQGFILRNSWGKSWADSGHTVYPYSDFGVHYEIWTAVDDPNSQRIERPIEEPKPKKERSRKGIFSIFKKIFGRG